MVSSLSRHSTHLLFTQFFKFDFLFSSVKCRYLPFPLPSISHLASLLLVSIKYWKIKNQKLLRDQFLSRLYRIVTIHNKALFGFLPGNIRSMNYEISCSKIWILNKLSLLDSVASFYFGKYGNKSFSDFQIFWKILLSSIINYLNLAMKDLEKNQPPPMLFSSIEISPNDGPDAVIDFKFSF